MVRTIGGMAAWICLLTALLLNPVEAGTTRFGGIDTLLQKADLVVHGVFSEVRSEWRGKKIYTVGRFSVTQMIKGEPRGEVEVEYLGGTAFHPRLKTPVSMRSSEGVSFEQNDEAVLLLQTDAEGRLRIFGLSQGIIRIYPDPETGSKMLQGFRKIEVDEAAAGSPATVGSKPMSLDEFGAYARSLLQTEAAKQ